MRPRLTPGSPRKPSSTRSSSAGLRGDGRLLALNSYENRVYQVWLEDGSSVVAKFYRPGRWSDAQILEEHAFVLELAEREIPAVPPLAPEGRTLSEHAGFRFAVFPRRGGRTPELERRDTLEWIGRFIGRIHAVGAVRPFAVRPTLDMESFGREPRDWLLAHAFLPPDLLEAWTSAVDLALQSVAHCYARAGDVQTLRLHGDCHAGNILWTDQGPHFVDFDDARTGPAVQDLWMLLSGERAAMTRAARRRARRLRAVPRVRSARAAPGGGAAHAAPYPLLRRGSRGAGTTRPFPPPSPGSTRSATGRTGYSSCASRSR